MADATIDSVDLTATPSPQTKMPCSDGSGEAVTISVEQILALAPDPEPGADGTDGASIVSAAFVGNDLVFTKDDTAEVVIVGGKAALTGAPGADGSAGDSAYAIAVANGFVGDEATWLTSMLGQVGPAGPTGPQGSTGATGPQGDAGADGESAYEVAVANGFIGDEAAWLLSLVGEPGAPGADGMTNPMTAAGDIIIGGTGGTPTRLAKGTDGQFLGFAGGTVAVVNAPTSSSNDLTVAEIIVGTGTNSGKTLYVGSGNPVSSINFSDLDGNAAGGYTLHGSIELSESGEISSTINGDNAMGNYSYYGNDTAANWSGTGTGPRMTYAYAGASFVSQIDRLPNGKIVVGTVTGDNNGTPHHTSNAMIRNPAATNITAIAIWPTTAGTTISVGSKFTLLRRK